MLPNFIVIGGHKAGSTWVAEVLSHHPDVFMYHTEIPFFENPDYQQRDLDWLAQHFEAVDGQAAVGMKRPNLLGLPECPGHIREHFPQAKLIAMLRHPVDRAVSAYFHLMRSGLLPIMPLEEGMRHILDGDWDQAWPAAKINVLQYGFYHQHIMRYLDTFPREQLLVLLYHRIQHHADDVFAQMCRFLGVREIEQPAALTRRVMEGAYSIPRLRMLSMLRFVYRRISPDRMRTHQRRGPVAAVVRFGVRGIDQTILARVFAAKRPVPSLELQQRLIALYADDVEKLSSFLDEDLSAWLRPREPVKS